MNSITFTTETKTQLMRALAATGHICTLRNGSETRYFATHEGASLLSQLKIACPYAMPSLKPLAGQYDFARHAYELSRRDLALALPEEKIAKALTYAKPLSMHQGRSLHELGQQHVSQTEQLCFDLPTRVELVRALVKGDDIRRKQGRPEQYYATATGAVILAYLRIPATLARQHAGHGDPLSASHRFIINAGILKAELGNGNVIDFQTALGDAKRIASDTVKVAEKMTATARR